MDEAYDVSYLYYYCFKFPYHPDGEDIEDNGVRLVTPFDNEEQPFELMFTSVTEASDVLDEYELRDKAIEEKWVLCSVRVNPRSSVDTW